MAPILPSSLSPHICILPSPDLVDLLTSSSLPPLSQILQSFSPLPQVTTRTITLTPVPHPSFALRFSDLAEIEAGCREDEEQRAGRTIDWISARVSRRCAKWVENWERAGAAAAEKEGSTNIRTPWWDELKRCVEGDHIPSTVEGWNHPVAVVLAVSTMAPNPLQALTQLHARPPEFPVWVDNTYLVYSLIIHPQNSSLSNEEAGALFNAVKKQYGLQSYLLPLAMPSPPPPPVPVPLLAPRLPPPPQNSTDNGLSDEPPSAGPVPNTLRMNEQDIQQTARFMREFVAMSLVPWMEKCVVEWNENYSSKNRLPSRLFSSTRRLFGSASTSITPSHGSNPSTSSVSSRGHGLSGSISSLANSPGLLERPPQQRRLAEFATILRDYKLAISVWESTRKEGKNGSEILPMLLAPSPAIPLHVTHALSLIRTPQSDLSALSQLRALVYAVRWETSIASSDFLSSVLEGDKWLVWAASSNEMLTMPGLFKAEEPPSALLLAHAAYLSVRKRARRRAALWYLFAANRLEKFGIKPLTMYFLRRAHELYKISPEKELSPSFWDAEGVDSNTHSSLEAIIPGIDHALGRLHYTSGDVERGVRFFLGLLHGSTGSINFALSEAPIRNGVQLPKSVMSDKVFLEDFRVAFQHLRDTAEGPLDLSDVLSDMKLPVPFCIPRYTRLRVPGDSVGGDLSIWEAQEDTWKEFWKTRGKEGLQSIGKATVNETFWVDLTLQNPLDVDVNLANLTVVVKEEHSDTPADFVGVEVIDDIILSAKETRTIPLAMHAQRSGILFVTHASYEFLSLLPVTESLGTRGRRLQETPLQRQSKMYAPDVHIKVEVEDACQKLSANFVEDGRLVLAEGECKRVRLWLSNTGSETIGEMWLIAGAEDEFWIDAPAEQPDPTSHPQTEVLRSTNSLAAQRPYRIPLETLRDSLPFAPGGSMEFSLTLHANHPGEHELCLLFVFREKEGDIFRSARVTRQFEVQPIISVSTRSAPSRVLEHLFLLDLDITNVSASSDVSISQVTTLSPTWSCSAVSEYPLDMLTPSQVLHLPLGVDRWENELDTQPTIDFISNTLRNVLQGQTLEPSEPPPIDVLCSHVFKTPVYSVLQPIISSLVHQRRRNLALRKLTATQSNIPAALYPSTFPLYHPHAVDVLIFWEIPSEQRSGHILISGAILGAGHAALKEIVEEAQEAKVKRSMYAETQREKSAVLDAIRTSEWNAEMNPLVLTLQQGEVVKHDFSKGPCHAVVPFTLRNYSLTHSCKYTLKLASGSSASHFPDALSHATYAGRLTYRGILEPLQYVIAEPTLYAPRPDTYALSGWILETEVAQKETSWRPRSRYVQEPSNEDAACITVVNVSSV